MDRRQRNFKTPLTILKSDSRGSSVEESARSLIKNPSSLYPRFCSHRFPGVGTKMDKRPPKTIDGGRGQQNDRSAILLTSPTPHPNIGEEKHGHFGFRRARR